MLEGYRYLYSDESGAQGNIKSGGMTQREPIPHLGVRAKIAFGIKKISKINQTSLQLRRIRGMIIHLLY
jgi:hypothetical protein